MTAEEIAQLEAAFHKLLAERDIVDEQFALARKRKDEIADELAALYHKRFPDACK